MQPQRTGPATGTYTAAEAATFGDLEQYLHDLNYEHGIDHGAIIAEGIMYSAFCTDPDGAWILETGDPAERISDEDDEQVYTPLQLGHIKNAWPFTVLHAGGTA